MTSKDDVGRLTVDEAKRRNYSRDDCLAVLSTLYQESGFDETIWDATHVTYGVAQQDGSYTHRFEGAAAQIAAFFDKLDTWRRKPGASGDIWLNIGWMQQRPNWPSAQYWFDNGRRAYLSEIQSRIATVTPYLDKYWPTESGESAMTWTGDPVWLEDVLRPALGDRLKTMPGWQDAGHGDYQDIRGVMVHHTGNGRADAASIRNGRPDLDGPLSNLHIAQDGTVTIVAVGVCWHAGAGSYPWLPTNNANWHMIGIECAWPMDPNNPGERWPDAQIISMRDTCAALALKLGVDASHVIGHKEYAGAAQGKWDPGNMDMNWFRGEVAKDMRGEFDGPKPPAPAPQPGPILPPDYGKETWDQLRIEWDQLGGRTVVNALGAIGEKLRVEGCYDMKHGKPKADN